MDSQILLEGLNKAIIGSSTKDRVVYSVEKVLKVLMGRHKISKTEAYEYFYHNIEGAYLGEYTPIFMFKADESSLIEELLEHE